LTQGRVEYHDRGDLRLHLTASCALPGLLPPVPINGDLHVDGGVLDVLPWRRAMTQTKRPLIVLDCHQGRSWQGVRGEHALSLLLASFALSRHHGARVGLDRPGIHVAPGPDVRGVDTFSEAVELIDASYHMTRSWIDEGGLEPDSMLQRVRRLPAKFHG
jgi:NTE family protein